MSDSLLSGKEGTAKLIYILYLAGLVTGGLTSIIGVVMAYMNRDDADEWLQSHYQFLIRTFWIGVVFAIAGWLTFVLGTFLTVILIGFVLIPAAMLFGLFTVVWLIIRCVKGIKLVDELKPIAAPMTWMFP